MPTTTATIFANEASNADMIIVRQKLAARFCRSTEPRRNDKLNVPVWMEVDRRLPSVENTLPLRPMAGVTMMSEPGRAWNEPRIPTRVAPAMKLVAELKTRAMNDWRAAPPVGPRRSTRRRTRRGGARLERGKPRVATD